MHDFRAAHSGKFAVRNIIQDRSAEHETTVASDRSYQRLARTVPPYSFTLLRQELARTRWSTVRAI
jgi:hypothetical protein